MGFYPLDGTVFFPPTERISFEDIRYELKTNLDLSTTKRASFTSCSLNETILTLPTEEIYFMNCVLPNKLDFSKTKEAAISCCDLQGVNLTFPIESIRLYGCTHLPEKLDFSAMKEVNLTDSDLTGVTKIKWPKKWTPEQQQKCLYMCKNVPACLRDSSLVLTNPILQKERSR